MAFVSFSQGFTPEQQQKIIAALGQKLRGCPACGKVGTWQLMTEGLVNIPIGNPGQYAYPASGGAFYGGPFSTNKAIPCIALTCANCGNLQFHSVLQLGLGPLFGFVASLTTFGPAEGE